jgi:ABC-type lipoprotein release transport system permease subunit
MSFTLKLAWRNIFRNKRRTIIAGIAIAVGLAAMIFTDAFMIGMKINMIKSATSSYLGQAQIHYSGYRTTQEPEKTVNELEKVVSELKMEKIIERFTLRAQNFGMITSPANVSSILLVGIDPETEKDISQIDDVIVEGKYIGNGGDRDMVIGSKLAEILEVGIGDRVVVTVSRAHGDDLAQEMFRISGIYRFNISELDNGMAFSNLEKVQSMLGIGNNVQEIAIKFKDIRFSLQKNNSFWEKYSDSGNEAVSWTEILPQITSALSMFEFVLYVMALILFGIVAFGIINTQFM